MTAAIVFLFSQLLLIGCCYAAPLNDPEMPHEESEHRDAEHPPPPPSSITPVFTDLTRDQSAELRMMVFDRLATRAQVKANIEMWVEKQDSRIKEQYKKHCELREQWKKSFVDAHSLKVAKLSPEAKELDEKLMAIWNNDELTIRDTCHKINELIETSSDSVMSELWTAIRNCNGGSAMEQFI